METENTEGTEDSELETEEFALEPEFENPEEQIEKDWREKTGLNETSLVAAIETIIFMSEKPVPLQKIRDALDPLMPLRLIKDSTERLIEDYEQSHRGLRIMEVAEGYQIRTKAVYSRFIQDMFKINSLVLSPTALEVLALVAYRQPVSRIEMDKIRGVDSSHILRALMDRRLVKISGRSEEMGRPVLYGITNEFLEVFNLNQIEDLPPEYELESMLDKNQMGQISDIKFLVGGGDRARFNFDDLEELDELQENIKGIATETFFTEELKKESKNQGPERRSAFDLLEDFVEKKDIVDQNASAVQSEVLTSVAETRVVSDLKEPNLNAPEPEDNWDLEESTGALDTSPTSAEEQFEELFEGDFDEEVDQAFEALRERPSSTLDNTEFEDFKDEDLVKLEQALSDKNEELEQELESSEIVPAPSDETTKIEDDPNPNL